MKITMTLAAISLFCSAHLHAAEADSFTRRSEPLKDSSSWINSRANEYLEKALKDLNAQKNGCDETKLYKELRLYFANHMSGQLTKEIINGNEVEKRPLAVEQSVYREWKFWDGLGMGAHFAARSGLTISPIINFNGEIIGADKFEHFFGQGYYYFNQGYIKKKGAIAAIKTGILKEKIFLGGNKLGNGVFSYGDLSANFNGMRFWNHILQKHDDILGFEHNLGPYVVCEENLWRPARKIDFRDYMDSSMDESINCSKFPAKKTAERFTAEVKRLGMSCPLDPQRLDEMAIKYGALSKWIINKDGTGVVRYFGEFKNK